MVMEGLTNVNDNPTPNKGSLVQIAPYCFPGFFSKVNFIPDCSCDEVTLVCSYRIWEFEAKN